MAEILQLPPHSKDLGGGFTVRRLLPAAACRAVGPFVFFDHFGPITARPEDNHDVRPHPHIGLATVTYLYEGAMQHHDSTGAWQRIEPGALNWMTAGRGVTHSERTPDDLRGTVRRSHGLQLWAALPETQEEVEPSFAHAPADALPVQTVPGLAGGAGDTRSGALARILIGTALGATSPVRAASPTVFVDLQLAPHTACVLQPSDTPEASERALYVSAGSLELDGSALGAFTMAVLPAGASVALKAGAEGARVALIGGEPMGPRYLYWNFVSSRCERLTEAADDWEAGRFPLVPGETEFIPLPDRRPLRST